MVVVPHRPGPLISLEKRPRRQRDDLDDLVDDMLPDVEDGPGPVDAAIVAAGLGLLAWALLGSTPRAVLVIGIVLLALGTVLPIRAAWRAAGARRDGRRRQALLRDGLPLDTSEPHSARLAAAYGGLVDRSADTAPSSGREVIAAAHATLLEVASLLGGRAPSTDQEVAYVERRASALDDLVRALHERELEDRLGDDGSTVATRLVLDARAELDRIAPTSSLSRLEQVTADVRSASS